MSIYATFFSLDKDDEFGAPIFYRGSHILPTDGDDRAGYVLACLIPSFISRGGDMGPVDEAPLPWLRLTVSSGDAANDAGGPSVLLDACQVRGLRDALTEWFHAPEDGGGRSWACTRCGGTGEGPTGGQT